MRVVYLFRWAADYLDLWAVVMGRLLFSHDLSLGRLKEMTWLLMNWEVAWYIPIFAVRSVLFVPLMIVLTFSASMLNLLVRCDHKFVECLDREMCEPLLTATLHQLLESDDA